MDQILEKIQELKRDNAEKDEAFAEQMRQNQELEAKVRGLEAQCAELEARAREQSEATGRAEARCAELEAQVRELRESASKANELVERLARELG